MTSPTLSVPFCTITVETHAAFVQPGFEARAVRMTIGVRLILVQLGDREDHVEQLVDASSLQGASRYHFDVATPLGREQAGGR